MISTGANAGRVMSMAKGKCLGRNMGLHMGRHLRHALSQVPGSALAAVCVGALALPVHAFAAVNDGAADDVVASTSGDKNERSISAQAFSAQELIKKMSDAINQLNYEGVFVHAQGTNLTSMRIVHANGRDGMSERLTALDGEMREVLRDNSLVTCIWPGSESVVVSQSKPRQLLPQIDASLANSDLYTFMQGQLDRVANRPTYVVDVVPRDKFRYGYRFWIDTQTSMLLRSMLLDGPSNPVEQVIFTEIDFPESIDAQRFDVLSSHDRDDVVSWLEPKRAVAESAVAAGSGKRELVADSSAKVSFAGLPEGYRKVSESYASMPIHDEPVSHVMLSDGMASVSVYVEYLGEGGNATAVLGLSSMGAMNAFGLILNSAQITAVGEVPVATVEAIARAVVLSE